jgi:1-deoxy-D-xylulose-5-phosphate synthase
VSGILSGKGIRAAVVNVRFIKPFDQNLLLEFAGKVPVISIEDNQVRGGLGSVIDEILINEHHKGVLHLGWGNDIIPHGKTAKIREAKGLSACSVAERIENFMSGIPS